MVHGTHARQASDRLLPSTHTGKACLEWYTKTAPPSHPTCGFAARRPSPSPRPPTAATPLVRRLQVKTPAEFLWMEITAGFVQGQLCPQLLRGLGMAFDSMLLVSGGGWASFVCVCVHACWG